MVKDMNPSREEIRKAARQLVQKKEVSIGGIVCKPESFFGHRGFIIHGKRRLYVHPFKAEVISTNNKYLWPKIYTEIFAFALERFFFDPNSFAAHGYMIDVGQDANNWHICVAIFPMMVPGVRKLFYG